MKQVGIYEAKTSLSALIAEVEATGEPIALTKHGRVVAELVPPAVATSPKAGMLKSDGFFLSPDFDAEGSGFEDFFAEGETLPPRLAKVAEDPGEYRTKNG